jgi:hypothetical protein
MQRDISKQAFDTELEELKKSLPVKYGSVVCALHPNVKLSNVHNVYHGSSRNWQILGYFREIVETQKKNLPEIIS